LDIFNSDADVAQGDASMSEANNPPTKERKWVQLSEDEARAHPLFGVRGWLLFIVIFLSIGWVAYLIFFLILFLLLLLFATTGFLGTELGYRYDHFHLILFGGLSLHSVALLRLFTHATTAPRWLGFLLTVMIAIGLPFIYFEHRITITRTFLFSNILLFSGIVLVFLQMSKRMNITYRRRAKPEWLANPTGDKQTS
jgi:hypothetical protein